ncbi:MAG: 5'-nucleotidase [Bacteroidota bacterium]
MPTQTTEKLVIAIASSALFDLSEADAVYKNEGEEAYRVYQEQHIDVLLQKGVAFPFIRRLLALNTIFPNYTPIEVILMSRNSPETGMRVFRSIQQYGLDISKASFFSGSSPYEYLPAYKVSLFLSAHEQDVRKAVQAGYPAGYVLSLHVDDNEDDMQLRIAFDFDGVLVDDAAEKVYKSTHDIQQFHAFETSQATIPHKPGPLKNLLQKISTLQQIEKEMHAQDKTYTKNIQVSLITARCSPSHERVIHTLKKWGVTVDQAFFLGGEPKRDILQVLKPHIFFDDQISHFSGITDLAMVHIPFGIANTSEEE